jgi:hypothetical protein
MRMSVVRATVVVIALLNAGGIAVRGQSAGAAALVRTLNAELLASRSATQVLSRGAAIIISPRTRPFWRAATP